MIAVIYDPTDGTILCTVQGPASSLAADPRAHIEVQAFRDDYDRTHRVIDGQLVEKDLG